MKYLYTVIVIIVALGLYVSSATANQVYADSQTSLPSAGFIQTQVNTLPVVQNDERAEILKLYLTQYNSPLAQYSDDIVKEADENNIDWRWLAAISGVESNFGIMIPSYSYNAWGYQIYGNNTRSFESWDDGITTVSTALRQIYINQRGETTIYAIGSSYAADPDWAYKVQNYVDDIDQFANRFDKPNLSISL